MVNKDTWRRIRLANTQFQIITNNELSKLVAGIPLLQSHERAR